MNPAMMRYGVFADIHKKDTTKQASVWNMDARGNFSYQKKCPTVESKPKITREYAEFRNPLKGYIPSFAWHENKLKMYQLNVFTSFFIMRPQDIFQSLQDKRMIVPPIGLLGFGLLYVGVIFNNSPLRVAGGLMIAPPFTAIGAAEVIKQINKVI
jgi:hypothetical protein